MLQFRFPSLMAVAGSLALLTSPLPVRAQTAYFVSDGNLAAFDGAQKRAVHAALLPEIPAKRIHRFWGALADGRMLVTVGEPAISLDEHEGIPGGVPLFLLNPDGTTAATVAPEVLRAFPAPSGNTVAVISPARDLSIWRDGNLQRVDAPGRVSSVGWAPDGRRAVLSVYPPDWSPQRLNNAPTTEDFLRLQDCDLYMIDLDTLAVTSRLTSGPATEYGAFFSPSGDALFYVWLHPANGDGGLFRLQLDRDNGTSSSQTPVRLTRAGPGPGEAPLGRVGTYTWVDGAKRLVFEGGVPDGSGEIWVMDAAGTGARKIQPGRHPQKLADGSIAFQQSDGAPARLAPESLTAEAAQ
jgi:hypothetical protein